MRMVNGVPLDCVLSLFEQPATVIFDSATVHLTRQGCELLKVKVYACVTQ